MTIDIIIAIIEIVVAIIWIQQGIIQYGFWINGKPGGGFVPVIFASLILVISFFIILREIILRKNNKRTYYRFKSINFIPALAAMIGIFMIYLLGIVAAVFLLTVLWMHYLSKYSWTKTIIWSSLFSLFIYCVFQVWLNVPFPEGLIYKLLY